MKKLRMSLEALEVESFRTTSTPAGPGTVHGRDDDCTWYDSCLCHTAYYQCGTGPQTIHSCDYTYNERCETLNELCERTAVDCLNTAYVVCGTRQETPTC